MPTVQAKNPGFGTHAASQIKTPGETRLTLLPPMTLQYYDPASFILAGRPPCPELTPAPPNMGRAQDVSTNGCPKLLLSLPGPQFHPGPRGALHVHHSCAPLCTPHPTASLASPQASGCTQWPHSGGQKRFLRPWKQAQDTWAQNYRAPGIQHMTWKDTGSRVLILLALQVLRPCIGSQLHDSTASARS